MEPAERVNVVEEATVEATEKDWGSTANVTPWSTKNNAARRPAPDVDSMLEFVTDRVELVCGVCSLGGTQRDDANA